MDKCQAAINLENIFDTINKKLADSDKIIELKSILLKKKEQEVEIDNKIDKLELDSKDERNKNARLSYDKDVEYNQILIKNKDISVKNKTLQCEVKLLNNEKEENVLPLQNPKKCNKCSFILVRGKRKGEQCGKSEYMNGLCLSHLKKEIKK
jgi:hypothetical protein